MVVVLVFVVVVFAMVLSVCGGRGGTSDRCNNVVAL